MIFEKLDTSEFPPVKFGNRTNTESPFNSKLFGVKFKRTVVGDPAAWGENDTVKLENTPTGSTIMTGAGLEGKFGLSVAIVMDSWFFNTPVCGRAMRLDEPIVIDTSASAFTRDPHTKVINEVSLSQDPRKGTVTAL